MIEYDSGGLKRPKEYRVRSINYPAIENLMERVYGLDKALGNEARPLWLKYDYVVIAKAITSLRDAGLTEYYGQLDLKVFDSETDDMKFKELYKENNVESIYEVHLAGIYIRILLCFKRMGVNIPRYTNSQQDTIFQKDLQEIAYKNTDSIIYDMLNILFSGNDGSKENRLAKNLSGLLLYIDHYFQVKELKEGITMPLYTFIEWKLRLMGLIAAEKKLDEPGN